VKVQLPDNKADINLRYETGERYKVANVEFRMSDPSKPLPLKLKVLQSMVPWKEGDDYAFWRVNTLANNLTNSRYFNWSLVDTIKPNPIVKQLELRLIFRSWWMSKSCKKWKRFSNLKITQ